MATRSVAIVILAWLALLALARAQAQTTTTTTGLLEVTVLDDDEEGEVDRDNEDNERDEQVMAQKDEEATFNFTLIEYATEDFQNTLEQISEHLDDQGDKIAAKKMHKFARKFLNHFALMKLGWDGELHYNHGDKTDKFVRSLHKVARCEGNAACKSRLVDLVNTGLAVYNIEGGAINTLFKAAKELTNCDKCISLLANQAWRNKALRSVMSFVPCGDLWTNWPKKVAFNCENDNDEVTIVV